jgi:hypothetical protein
VRRATGNKVAPTGQGLPVAMPAQPALDLENVVRQIEELLAFARAVEDAGVFLDVQG